MHPSRRREETAMELASIVGPVAEWELRTLSRRGRYFVIRVLYTVFLLGCIAMALEKERWRLDARGWSGAGPKLAEALFNALSIGQLDVHFTRSLEALGALVKNADLGQKGGVEDDDFRLWMNPMPHPYAPKIVLSDQDRQDLEALIRAHSTPQTLACRARIVLRAADPDQPNNREIAAEMGIWNDTVGIWRRRFAEQRLAGLQDAPRSGRPKSVSPRSPNRRHIVGQPIAGRLGVLGHAVEPG